MISPFVEVRRALRSLRRAVMVQTRLPIGRAPFIHARGQINPFTLEQPVTLREAAVELAYELDARIMAGGIDLINEMKQGGEVRHVVHIGKVARLHGIEITREHLLIGAAATHANIERDPNVAAVFPNLPGIVSEIANVRVRAVGTVGGNIMIGNRGYDWLPILLALGAEISFEDHEMEWYPVDVLVGDDGRWRIPHRLLREIRIPLWGNPVLRFNRDLKPAISLAICLRSGARARTGRIAVGCVHAAPVVREVLGFDELDVVTPTIATRPANHSITGGPRTDAIAETLGAQVAARFPKPHDDGLVGSGYRQAMMRTLSIRGLAEALENA